MIPSSSESGNLRPTGGQAAGQPGVGAVAGPHDQSHYYTSAHGQPFPSLTNSLNVGGHTVQSYTILLEKQQAFDRMKIQERIVHPGGSGAFGRFEVTKDVSHLTKAVLFQPGAVTPCTTRFSTVTVGRGYPDSARNPRGFATKCYTPEGNYDLVGLNWPIFFVFLLDFQAWFDFLSNVPESIHAGTMLLGDHGTPVGWRFMNGFGCHTFSWVNKEGKVTYIKYHWLSEQGTKNHSLQQGTEMCGTHPYFAKRDLYDHLAGGGHAAWKMAIQTMTLEQAQEVEFDPFDVTKVWPRKEFPMQEVGRLVLDRNPENYHRNVEQVAFSPGALVPGIQASPDALLRWRMFFYRDAQYHRLGVNLHQVPVNCPFMVRSQAPDNYDGAMRVDANSHGKPQYVPNFFHGDLTPSARPDTAEVPMQFGSNTLSRKAHFKQRGQRSEYDQARELWTHVMSDEEREDTAYSMAFLLKFAEPLVQKRYLAHLRAVSPDYASMVFEGLPKKAFELAEVEALSQDCHMWNVDPNFSLPATEKGKTGSFMGMGVPQGSPHKFA